MSVNIIECGKFADKCEKNRSICHRVRFAGVFLSRLRLLCLILTLHFDDTKWPFRHFEQKEIDSISKLIAVDKFREWCRQQQRGKGCARACIARGAIASAQDAATSIELIEIESKFLSPDRGWNIECTEQNKLLRRNYKISEKTDIRASDPDNGSVELRKKWRQIFYLFSICLVLFPKPLYAPAMLSFFFIFFFFFFAPLVAWKTHLVRICFSISSGETIKMVERLQKLQSN